MNYVVTYVINYMLALINEVTLHWARLVYGWVIISRHVNVLSM